MAAAAGRGRIEGRRCLVTGGSRGLGRAVAQAFAHEGGKVAFTYSRSDEDAAEVLEGLRAVGAGALSFKGSVADARHAQETVDAVVAAWGGLDCLCCCAGVTQILPIALIEEADWDRVMAVNAKGSFLFARAALRPMMKARRGSILLVGSFASERTIEAPVHYAASKAALRGFAEALAREVGRYGVAVNVLSPGILDVGLGRKLPQHRLDEYLSQCPLGRLGSAEEVAAAAAWLCSGENGFMTGAKVCLDGGV